ncbi:MAG: hypothetical protein PHT78_06940 [Desulfitobacteriaceae bacterium]|nr:hypothetical protein [Desulfitobacteriaceae bacterium]MDD4752973.1 hypothetical protein [Desulfitobacteriaceae bacterium]
MTSGNIAMFFIMGILLILAMGIIIALKKKPAFKPNLAAKMRERESDILKEHEETADD